MKNKAKVIPFKTREQLEKEKEKKKRQRAIKRLVDYANKLGW